MSEWTKTKPESSTGNSKPERVSLMRLNGGRLEMIRVSENRARELKAAGPERLSAYLDVAYRDRSDVEAERLRRFETAWRNTSCLLCEDRTYHNIPVTAPNGLTYDTAFGCVCEAGRALHTANILDIMQLGNSDLWCAFAATCPMLSRQGKCWSVKCPKFEGSAI
jgi:hypothetical protein